MVKNMTRISVVKRGTAIKVPEDTYLYEKASSTYEQVASLGGSKGTSDHQVKIYAGGIPLGVFDNQSTHPGKTGTPLRDSKLYAEDGMPVDFLTEGDFVFEGVLDQGQTVLKGQPLQFETNTGKIQLQTSNPRCGYAVEGKVASGADGVILVKWDPEKTVIETESVTVTAHVGTLTYTPIEIHAVEATTGSSVGGKILTVNQTTPIATNVYWNGAKALTFNTTDAITAAKVRYRHA